MKQLIILSLLVCFFLSNSYAQLSLENGTTNYTIDFDATVSGVNAGNYTGAGFTNSPASGQLDADAWATTGLSDGAKNFGVANTSGDHARGTSTGGVSTGGIYGFDIGGGNRALGIQPTGSDWTPGTMTLKIVNNSSSVINDMTINYTIYTRNDQGRASSFNFSYSTNNSNYTNVSSANYTSVQAAGIGVWDGFNKSVQLSNLSLDPGADFYIRWAGSDVSGSGSRDEFALDDIAITAAGSTNSCVEPISQSTNLSFGTITSNSIQAGFSASAADKFLVVQSTSPSLGASPVDGVVYSSGNFLGTGEVLQFSNTTNINSLGLTENTTYYYFVFAANDDCSGGPDYLATNPLMGTAMTMPNGGSNYYSSIGNETCGPLKTALFNLIDGHTSVSYNSLWTHYQTTDDHLNDAGTEVIVWDMYSDNPTGFENEFTFISEQCGSYQGEGNCYNREHTFPKSWWGGSTSIDAYTDLFTVLPADGWINGIRSNNPYGEVQAGTETRITNNGTVLGSSSISIPGYSNSVFEPIDAYKGDLARGYFYMATRYENTIASWENNTVESDAVLDGTTYPVYEQWMIDMLINWHNLDPVDQKEIDRNEAVYAIQGNRNPFIDHPEYVGLIWNNCSGGGDTEAPTTPTNLSASNTTEVTTDLTWNGSTDNVGVIGYNIYQDGLMVATSATNSSTITGMTSGTTYAYYVTAYDAAGNESTFSNTINVTTTSPSSLTVLHEGYFETGWDGWQDGGSDCARYSGGYSSEGSYSIRIRDNSGTASAMTSPSFDISSYSTIDIDFSFYPRSMENNEDFWLRYYDGNVWQTIATFVKGVDFNNNTFYAINISIDNENYNFPSNAQFRFQCDASGNNDQIYIDEVVITADANTASRLSRIIENPIIATGNINAMLREESNELELKSAILPFDINQISIYPNPANEIVFIDFHSLQAEINRIEILNQVGQKVGTITNDFSNSIIRNDISYLTQGLYFIKFTDKKKGIYTLPLYVK